MDALWKPNGPGIDAFHTNNFVVSTPIKYPYKNFSNRTDYIVNDKLRVYGRFSRTLTPVGVTGNPTGSPVYMSDRGADYNMMSYCRRCHLHLEPHDGPQLSWWLSQFHGRVALCHRIRPRMVLAGRFPEHQFLRSGIRGSQHSATDSAHEHFEQYRRAKIPIWGLEEVTGMKPLTPGNSAENSRSSAASTT